MVNLLYDTPVEVNERAYNIIMVQCAGTCAGRESEDGKFYIKLWVMGDKQLIERIIKNAK